MINLNKVNKLVKKTVLVTVSGLAVLSGLAFTSQVKVNADCINDKIILPDDSLGYTRSNIRHWDDNPIAKQQLKRASIIGMSYNDSHSDGDRAFTKNDRRVLDMKHLSGKDRRELAHFAIRTINSARNAMNLPSWTYSSNAERFAMNTAKYYTQDGAGNDDTDHDVHAILKAAKRNGLRTNLGQVYEDESGFEELPNARYQTMWHAKLMLRLNIEQMLFGNWTPRKLQPDIYYHDLKDPKRYVEWDHTKDLLDAHNHYDNPNKEIGVAFSVRGNDEVSVHILTVPQEYIIHPSKYYR